MARVRRNAMTLPAGDQTLYWYERAVTVMRQRPFTDPTSWRFQAAVHEYRKGQDPLAVPGEQLPTPDVQKGFWTKCQHGTWFFLPWHRMYLHLFEEMISAIVVSLGGPGDWGLPYWNYSASLDARLLPAAFRQPKLADGTDNALYVAQRDPRCNDGIQFADDQDVDLEFALGQNYFSDPSLGNFGGLQTPFEHGGKYPGHLEGSPHGTMHTAVGGQSGWMGAFNTAALDPIFWLHHSNIDRLWEVWIKMNTNPTHQDPTSLQWLNMVSFSFYNAAQQVVVMRSSDVVSTAALGYSYDDTTNPLPAAAPATAMLAAAPLKETRMPDAVPPELVGATDTGFTVGNSPVRVTIATPAHAAARDRITNAAAAVRTAGEPVAQAHVLLQIENITSQDRANSYDVYINVPDGEDPAAHKEQHVGRLSMFGVAEASLASDTHPGSGLSVTLDITKVYNKLAAEPGWDPNNLQVSLVPVRNWKGADVKVGRISVFLG